jgi:putative MATE family efflux protein
MQLFGERSRLRREILEFTWPVILTNLLQTLTVTVNTIMVGHLGPSSVAGVGLGSQLVFLAFSVMIAISAGSIALVARYTGAKDPERANRVLRQSLVLSFLLSIPFIVLGAFFSGHLMKVFGAEADVEGLGAVYVKWIFIFAPLSFMEFMISAALRGAGDMKTPLYVAIVNNLVNILVGWLLIFGNLGFPEMGVTGASIANVVAFTVGSLLLVSLLWGGKLRLRLAGGNGLFDREIVGKIVKIGWPAAAEQLLLQTGFLVFTAIIVYFGTVTLAAHQIGARVQGMAFMPGMGMSLAATALVGQSLGACDPKRAEECGWESTKLAILIMTGIGALMFIFADPVSRVFIADAETVRLAALWIRIQAFVMPAVGLHFTLSGALRGAGDTRWPLFATLIGVYAVRLPIAWVVGIPLGWGVVGCWIAFVVEYYVRAAVIVWRFRLGSWKCIKV